MALTTKSGFIYSYTVTDSNRYLDFAKVAAGTELNAVLRQGLYGLSELLAEFKRALETADTSNTYTVTVDRTISAGTQNRITISTSGTALELRFGTGTNAGISCAALLGYAASDLTGATSYTGTSSTGSYLFPSLIGYSYQPITTFRRAQGVVNVSAAGVKETLTFSTQEFFQVEFKYEPEASTITTWSDFFSWAIKGAEVEFFTDISNPSSFTRCTLEKTDQDGKGQGYLMKEMLPDFPFFYRTGIMQFRKVVT